MDAIARQKDTDLRPMLLRVRDALATGTSARFEDTRTDAGDLVKVISIGDTVTVTATEATAIKGVILLTTGLTPKAQKALLSVKGTRTVPFGQGVEVSWRGLEAACSTLVDAMKARPVAARAPRVVAPKPAPVPLSTRLLKAVKAAPAVRWHMDGAAVMVRSTSALSSPVSVTVDGQAVVVGFSYAADAVAAIKRVGGGRYVAAAQKWAFVEADESRLLSAIERASVACGIADRDRKAAWEAGAPARAQRVAEEQAAREAAFQARATTGLEAKARREQETPRILTLLSDRHREGQVVRSGDHVLVITAFGKVFRVDEDMPSMGGSWLLGHEGAPCRYAYCRPATEAEAASLAA